MTFPEYNAANGSCKTPAALLRGCFLAAAVLAVLAVPRQGPALAQALPAGPVSPPFSALAARLTAGGADPAMVSALFSREGLVYDPSVMARKVDLMLVKEFEPPKTPLAPKSLNQSAYKQFLRPWILAWAYSFMEEHAATLGRAEAAYQVPPEIVTAVILVETKLGSYTGSRAALISLASLAASDSLEPIRPYLKQLKGSPERAAFAQAAAKDRSEWAYQELVALLAYAQAAGRDPMSIPGSIFGAIGFCQFMPSNITKFAADGDGDGRIDLFVMDDALFSVASYLKAHGWRPDLGPQDRQAVIYTYNHSNLYVLAILTIADQLRDLRTKHGRM